MALDQERDQENHLKQTIGPVVSQCPDAAEPQARPEVPPYLSPVELKGFEPLTP